MKNFRLRKEQMERLAYGYGACIASDHITVDGMPVGFMYREEPSHQSDSGWRFLSGTETEEYMDDAANHGVYDVNTIANYDRSIIPLLDSPPGSAFQKTEGGRFEPLPGWRLPES